MELLQNYTTLDKTVNEKAADAKEIDIDLNEFLQKMELDIYFKLNP